MGKFVRRVISEFYSMFVRLPVPKKGAWLPCPVCGKFSVQFDINVTIFQCSFHIKYSHSCRSKLSEPTNVLHPTWN